MLKLQFTFQAKKRYDSIDKCERFDVKGECAMKKTAKRILTVIMAALLMISVISPSAVHAETESVNVETSAGSFESVEPRQLPYTKTE